MEYYNIACRRRDCGLRREFWGKKGSYGGNSPHNSSAWRRTKKGKAYADINIEGQGPARVERKEKNKKFNALHGR